MDGEAQHGQDIGERLAVHHRLAKRALDSYHDTGPASSEPKPSRQRRPTTRWATLRPPANAWQQALNILDNYTTTTSHPRLWAYANAAATRISVHRRAGPPRPQAEALPPCGAHGLVPGGVRGAREPDQGVTGLQWGRPRMQRQRWSRRGHATHDTDGNPTGLSLHFKQICDGDPDPLHGGDPLGAVAERTAGPARRGRAAICGRMGRCHEQGAHKSRVPRRGRGRLRRRVRTRARLTAAPYTSAKCAAIFPVVNTRAGSDTTSSARRCWRTRPPLRPPKRAAGVRDQVDAYDDAVLAAACPGVRAALPVRQTAGYTTPLRDRAAQPHRPLPPQRRGAGPARRPHLAGQPRLRVTTSSTGPGRRHRLRPSASPPSLSRTASASGLPDCAYTARAAAHRLRASAGRPWLRARSPSWQFTAAAPV
jgi:hypothetical protein